MNLLLPALRAVEQLDDHAFLGVMLRSVAWAALASLALAGSIGWAAYSALQGHQWLTWLGPAAGIVAAALLILFLFLPLASVIASLFIERIAAAVERRYYPTLPPPRPAPATQQMWDATALGLRVLGMQLVALVLALLLPGPGLLLGWAVSAWAIGRGLFMAVAMRRMNRPDAQALYRTRVLGVLAQGGLITAGSLIPVLNLLTPLLGTAAMVHLLHNPEPRPRGL